VTEVVNDSPIPRQSNTANPRPSVLSAWRAPPSCDGCPRAPGAAVHDAPSARPVYGGPGPDICDRILASRWRARALSAVRCGRPSCARRVSACPRISILRASAGVRPSSPQSSAPCLRAWLVRSTVHRAGDNACFQEAPNFCSSLRCARIELSGLREERGLAPSHVAGREGRP
jgi:hypothetical protein